ncbi:transcriptional regulator [Terrilactibacillus laevilacticus]|uniref:Transcriptional regulator n=1 Tax=Terrilactibacillus laevilacticus TaxID=1380157 RepID=A0ABW5PL91_9BACI|nr:transcriptional regulator [Terrilactibacillus laevilacticus]
MNIITIGPDDLVELINQEAEKMSELKIIPAPYKNEQETLQLVKQHLETTDIFLFAGPIPYELTKKYYSDSSKKLVYIPFTGTALYRTLFKIVEQYGDSLIRTRLSIDTLHSSEVEECFEELEIIPSDILFKRYEQEKGVEELFKFHYEHWINNEVDVAITCVYSVYEKLRKLEIPVFQVIPTKSSIRSSLQQVMLEYRSLQNADIQIAIIMIQFENFSETKKQITSNYKVQREKTILQNVVIDFSEEIQALFSWENDRVRFVTTRGTIERKTKMFKEIPILNELYAKAGIESHLGIGFGRTANEAETKANSALYKACQNKRKGYVVDFDGSIKAIDENLKLNYSIRSIDPRRVKLAKKTGFSVETINKIMALSHSLDIPRVTAIEFANELGITVRSARRILSTLEKSQLATIVGEEQPINRGRPRKIYSLNMNID